MLSGISFLDGTVFLGQDSPNIYIPRFFGTGLALYFYLRIFFSPNFVKKSMKVLKMIIRFDKTNPKRSGDFTFQNPGIGIWVQFWDSAGACKQVMHCSIVSFLLTFNTQCKTPEEGVQTCLLKPPILILAKGNAVSAIEKSAFPSQFKKVPEWRHLWRKVWAGGINVECSNTG